MPELIQAIPNLTKFSQGDLSNLPIEKKAPFELHDTSSPQDDKPWLVGIPVIRMDQRQTVSQFDGIVPDYLRQVTVGTDLGMKLFTNYFFNIDMFCSIA